MIEILEFNKYKSYKLFKGVYFVYFYNKEGENVTDIKNLSLIKFLQSIEIAYSDLPILGFEYNKFINFYKHENISSPNDIVVIGQFKPTLVYKEPTPQQILEILNSVREKRFELFLRKNTEIKSKQFNIWFINKDKQNLNRIYISDEERINNQNRLMSIKNFAFNIVEPFKTYASNNTFPRLNSPQQESFDKKKNMYRWRVPIIRENGTFKYYDIPKKMPYIDLNVHKPVDTKIFFNFPCQNQNKAHLNINDKSSCQNYTSSNDSKIKINEKFQLNISKEIDEYNYTFENSFNTSEFNLNKESMCEKIKLKSNRNVCNEKLYGIKKSLHKNVSQNKFQKIKTIKNISHINKRKYSKYSFAKSNYSTLVTSLIISNENNLPLNSNICQNDYGKNP